ncbi:MAG: hypothetical protein KDB23_05725 [Planctomycetales bacterium]|nr:hypothetical protein [Planctomycetales bacterium]
MRLWELIKLAIVASIVSGSVQTVVADLTMPPSYMGGPLTVQAEWEFSSPFVSSAIPPDFFLSIPGSGVELLYDGFDTHIDLDSASNWIWTPGDGNGGITPSGSTPASLGANVQNWIDILPIKFLRIEITYQGQPPLIGPVIGTDGSGPAAATPVGHFPVDGNHYYEDWVIKPNPDWEQIQITVLPGSVLDEIYVNTISAVPEPSSVLLVGLCLSGAVIASLPRWLKRKRN